MNVLWCACVVAETVTDTVAGSDESFVCIDPDPAGGIALSWEC